MTESPRRPDIFLSYSSTDKAAARDLYRLLADADLSVWFDEASLVPGTEWEGQLRTAISSARVILLLVGESSLGKWQSMELRAILERATADERMNVVPVLLPGSSVDFLPSALRAYQAIDLRSAPNEATRLTRIAAALTKDSRSGDIVDSEEIGDRLRESGDWLGSIAPYDKALAVATATHGDSHPSVARILRKIGVSHLSVGNSELAESFIRRALAITVETYGAGDARVTADLSNLATVYESRGDLKRAEDLQREVLATCIRVLGSTHPDTLMAMNNLAGTVAAQGDLSEARALQEKVFSMRSDVLGRQHPDTLTSASNLAATLADMGDLVGARQLQESVLSARQSLLGSEHPSTLTSANNLASTLRSMGAIAEARALQESVLERITRTLGEEHPDTLTVANNLAMSLLSLDQPLEAQRLLERVLQTHLRLYGVDHPNSAVVLANLAIANRQSGDYAAATTRFRQAATILERAFGPEHEFTKQLLQSAQNLRDEPKTGV
jgi:tetratricopeptide (TPR) repeat protein